MDTPQPPSPAPQPPRNPISARSGAAPSPGLPQAGALRGTRSYPKPPPLLVRLLLLCFKPEAWAETARYPLHVTLIPLLLAIVIGAIAISYGETSRLVASLQNFAATYEEHHYPPLQLDSKGVLSVDGDLPDPIRFELSGMPVLIDPTGKTRPDSLKYNAIVITDKNAVLVSEEGSPFSVPLTTASMFLAAKIPAPGTTKIIDGPSLRVFVANRLPNFVFSGALAVVFQVFIDSIWATLMMLLLSPLVTLAAAGPRPEAGTDRRLMLPRRAAYRMAAGLLVPAVLISAGFRASGHPLQATLGMFTLGFWFLATGGMAIWTGILARRMYGPKPPVRQAARRV